MKRDLPQNKHVRNGWFVHANGEPDVTYWFSITEKRHDYALIYKLCGLTHLQYASVFISLMHTKASDKNIKPDVDE